ncbi:MAG: cyclodeaminase/cyclohydrolase family protein [Deltaproteobacteria bacterium]|nr:cyclodeaminase/cyclohydrolase family protein [Deltaproteobacteria bacterium]
MGLTDLSVTEYVHRVAEGTAAPGGGSVCALVCSLSAALCLMAAHLTLGREKYSDAWGVMEELSRSMEGLLSRSLKLAQQDADAYGNVMAAFKMGRGDKTRTETIQAAMKQAALIPMETLRILARITDLVGDVIERGNPNCLCDAGVAVQLIRAATKGAAYNVRANLSKIDDRDFASRMQSEMTSLENNIEQVAGRFESFIELLLSS